ncbi:hypothetical protein DLAC_08325 [Tieghemostelium lacteum]|uniref:Kelch repeat-containing protein n=1 Tax=Tieghemostelium lacteum TaxID=361077 RepID=A0A151ZBQ3_TIELA|nr:hypothetical protein DLAC_08325 [Tieghemostelium lacteum]|eukprot:KYQ91369.1 hypothetical protein DLAC_08325 [Tieghemostelium lacteum]
MKLLIQITTLLILFSVCFSKKCNNQPYWNLIPQNGAIPPPLWDGASAYDEKNELFYMFGGLNGTYPSDYPVNAFYIFDVKTYTWTNLESNSTPIGRAEAMLWVDKRTGYPHLSGGRYRFRSGQNIEYNTTHYYNTATNSWTELSQTVAQQNMANRSTEAILIRQKAYAYAGSTSTLGSFINRPGGIQNNVIEFDRNNGWSIVEAIGAIPTPRAHHHLGYDKDTNSIFTYGGYTKDPVGNATFSPNNYLSDLWRFDLDTRTWINYQFNGTSPGKRDNAKIVHVDEHELYLIGGSDYTGANYLDLWRFDFNTNTWERVVVQAEIDPFTNKSNLPTPIGSYYFTRETSCGYEFWMFAGSASEFGGALYNGFFKLTIPK